MVHVLYTVLVKNIATLQISKNKGITIGQHNCGECHWTPGLIKLKVKSVNLANDTFETIRTILNV